VSSPAFFATADSAAVEGRCFESAERPVPDESACLFENAVDPGTVSGPISRDQSHRVGPRRSRPYRAAAPGRQLRTRPASSGGSAAVPVASRARIWRRPLGHIALAQRSATSIPSAQQRVLAIAPPIAMRSTWRSKNARGRALSHFGAPIIASTGASGFRERRLGPQLGLHQFAAAAGNKPANAAIEAWQMLPREGSSM